MSNSGRDTLPALDAKSNGHHALLRGSSHDALELFVRMTPTRQPLQTCTRYHATQGSLYRSDFTIAAASPVDAWRAINEPRTYRRTAGAYVRCGESDGPVDALERRAMSQLASKAICMCTTADVRAEDRWASKRSS